MTSIKCRICGDKAKFAFKTDIMNGKFNISYFICEKCDFLQVEKPYWLDEAYASPINLTDTGIILRNLQYSKIVATLIYIYLDIKHSYLDFAGGFGIFTRMMRDLGLDFYWHDIYTQNLVARGFESKPDEGSFKAMTAFETFEHFVEPMEEVEKIFQRTDTIIFSTLLKDVPIPDPETWWYYAREHGQHIALYSKKTLEYIAERLRLKLYTNGGDLHILTKQNLAPKIMLIEHVREIKKKLEGGDLALFSKAYKPIKRKHKILSFDSLRNLFHQSKYGRYLELNQSLSTKELARLADIVEKSNMSDAIFKDVLLKAYIFFARFVSPNLKSKTFEDMLAMKKFIHY